MKKHDDPSHATQALRSARTLRTAVKAGAGGASLVDGNEGRDNSFGRNVSTPRTFGDVNMGGEI